MFKPHVNFEQCICAYIKLVTILSFLVTGTIRATVMIETLLAAVNMEEMLYEIRDHCCGLNAGRWDYIFSIIKRFQRKGDAILPDRKQVRYFIIL